MSEALSVNGAMQRLQEAGEPWASWVRRLQAMRLNGDREGIEAARAALNDTLDAAKGGDLNTSAHAMYGHSIIASYLRQLDQQAEREVQPVVRELREGDVFRADEWRASTYDVLSGEVPLKVTAAAGDVTIAGQGLRWMVESREGGGWVYRERDGGGPRAVRYTARLLRSDESYSREMPAVTFTDTDVPWDHCDIVGQKTKDWV